MSGQIDGTYKTRRDGGLVYSFHATWTAVPGGVDWRATVVQDRKVAGNPTGFVAAPADDEFSKVLEKILFRYIEHRIGVM